MSSSALEGNDVSILRKSFVEKIIKNREITQFFLTVVGHSMWPFLRDGRRVLLRKVSSDARPTVGDVVAILKKNGMLVHRIIAIRHSKRNVWYLTKGDRRLATDGWVTRENIIGLVVANTRRRCVNFLIAWYSSLLFFWGKLLGRR